MVVHTSPYNSAEYLDTPKARREYFLAVLEGVLADENTGWIDQEQARRGSAKRSANRRWTRKTK